jgi:LPXTG-motif cell wall-anchored protein
LRLHFNNSPLLNGSLIPNDSVNFTVREFDAVPKLAAKISNYSLLVQTSTQQFNLPSSISPTPSTTSSDSSWLVYVGTSAVVIAVLAFAALVFARKRKKQSLPNVVPFLSNIVQDCCREDKNNL